ncbi:MAG: HAD-IB family hydrolase [Actinomycetota bacterium]|nr:HAD-IB family hydrolase [Actinomycetota bacterium]
MRAAAAFFDLDRTLLTTSSTPAFNQALFETGLMSKAGFPGQGLMMRFYELAGETLPSMALARAAAPASRGKAVAEINEAARLAAELLEAEIAPFARHLLDRHRDAGRPLVLATTTPADLVWPLAEKLGFDDVVATRYASREDAYGVRRYTGRLDGQFCWSVGKLLAVRRWAGDHDVDLKSSYAYSDSIYDLPLLAAVGHPTVVNPDYRLLPAAMLRSWPVVHLDAPAGVPKLFGLELLDLVRLLFPRSAFPYARFDISGTEHIPRRGGVIVAANHRSYFDPVAISMAVFDAGRHPRFMGKKEVFDAPIIGPLARACGSIMVDRDSDDGGGAAFDEARQSLECGEMVLILPQATIPRGEAFFDPKLKGKTGAARLAAAAGVPVVPVGVWGSEHVWPRASRLPNVTKVLSPPTVTVRVGAPVAGLDGADADTRRIMDAITALLPPEAKIRRIPSPEEVARAMPPGA